MNRTALIALFFALVLLVGCADVPEQEEVWEMEQESVAVFSDGETVDLWRARKGELRGSVAWYVLSDGTVLLLEDDAAGPENPGFLSEGAWAAIESGYRTVGLRYDIKALLDQAYTAYRNCQAEGWEYEPGRVGQSTALTASNEKVVWFCTTVNLTLDPANGQETRLTAVFDRETGEPLEIWSLFTAGETEVRAKLAAIGEEGFRAELAAALDPERIVFYPEYLEVHFPAGTVAGQTQERILQWDYDQLGGLLQPWAVPEGTEAAE